MNSSILYTENGNFLSERFAICSLYTVGSQKKVTPYKKYLIELLTIICEKTLTNHVCYTLLVILIPIPTRKRQ